MKSVDDNTIVGVGEDPEKALEDAEAKGFKDPVLLYIPEKDSRLSRFFRYALCPMRFALCRFLL
jgi:hypothetical protein